MIPRIKMALGLACVGIWLQALAVHAAGRETLALAPAKTTTSVLDSAEKANKRIELTRVVEALDIQLTSQVNSSRKFQVVSRSDLAEVMKEQEFGASGNVDPATAAQRAKMVGARYVLVPLIDDFQDHLETATFAGTGRSMTRRTLRLSCVANIYDSSTGKLLESPNLQIRRNDVLENRSYTLQDGDLKDEMLQNLARDMAGQITVRLSEIIFPAKVVARRDKQVTINRGDGSGIAVGQVWNVYAAGEELIDPDTQESLGREEIPAGKVRIVQVNPKTAIGEILEDKGIAKESILRLQ
ncbi:MAG TPA: CsgG/HfaB family protein [Candidatus Paceibacterota bacterium]|nr:CsgG/HfaB family protein [Candidatus Paceibacterota bacterium]